MSTKRGVLKDQQFVWTRQLHKWLQHVSDDCVHSSNSSTTPHLNVSAIYAATSTICNRTSVTLYDTSTPAIVPQFAELCMFPRIPKDANIVIFEMCANDCVDPDKMDTPDKRALESMLRQALSMPSRPAVMMLCVFRPQRKHVTCGPDAASRHAYGTYMYHALRPAVCMPGVVAHTWLA